MALQLSYATQLLLHVLFCLLAICRDKAHCFMSHPLLHSKYHKAHTLTPWLEKGGKKATTFLSRPLEEVALENQSSIHHSPFLFISLLCHPVSFRLPFSPLFSNTLAGEMIRRRGNKWLEGQSPICWLMHYWSLVPIRVKSEGFCGWSHSDHPHWEKNIHIHISVFVPELTHKLPHKVLHLLLKYVGVRAIHSDDILCYDSAA